MKKKFLLLITLIITVVIISSCATFTGEIPLEANNPEGVYISPANQDGIQDSFRESI